MRTFLLPLAGLLLVTGVARAEFDGAGIPTAKAKPAQATGAIFDASIAANKRNRAANEYQLLLTGVRPLVFAVPPPCGLVLVGGMRVTPQAPQPIIKNPSNMPRRKHPENMPNPIDGH